MRYGVSVNSRLTSWTNIVVMRQHIPCLTEGGSDTTYWFATREERDKIRKAIEDAFANQLHSLTDCLIEQEARAIDAPLIELTSEAE